MVLFSSVMAPSQSFQCSLFQASLTPGPRAGPCHLLGLIPTPPESACCAWHWLLVSLMCPPSCSQSSLIMASVPYSKISRKTDIWGSGLQRQPHHGCATMNELPPSLKMMIIVSTSPIYGEDQMKWTWNVWHTVRHTANTQVGAGIMCTALLSAVPSSFNKEEAQSERAWYEQCGEKAGLTAWDFWFEGTTKIFWICIMAAMLRISWEQPKFPIKQKASLISIIQCINEKWKTFPAISLVPPCKLRWHAYILFDCFKFTLYKHFSLPNGMSHTQPRCKPGRTLKKAPWVHSIAGRPRDPPCEPRLTPSLWAGQLHGRFYSLMWTSGILAESLRGEGAGNTWAVSLLLFLCSWSLLWSGLLLRRAHLIWEQRLQQPCPGALDSESKLHFLAASCLMSGRLPNPKLRACSSV